jgi:hypothetical protein
LQPGNNKQNSRCEQKSYKKIFCKIFHDFTLSATSCGVLSAIQAASKIHPLL